MGCGPRGLFCLCCVVMVGERAVKPDSLELRIERVKRLGNLRLYYLQRFCKRQGLIELYREGHVNLHVHTQLNGAYICGRYEVCRAGHRTSVTTENQVVVFVDVAHVSESPRPI